MIALNLISVLRITFTVSFQLFFCNISISMFVIDIDLLIKGSLSDLGFCGIFVFVFSFFFLVLLGKMNMICFGCCYLY